MGPGPTFFSRELLHSFSKLTCCTAELASCALICWFIPCESKGMLCEVITPLRKAPHTTGAASHTTGAASHTGGYSCTAATESEPHESHAQGSQASTCSQEAAAESARTHRTRCCRADCKPRLLPQPHLSGFLSTVHTGNVKKLNFKLILVPL